MSQRKPGVLFILFLLLFCGAVTLLFWQTEDFRLYTSGIAESAARVSAPVTESAAKRLPVPDNNIRYRTFYLTAPGAKEVELLADFNGWGKTPVMLERKKRDYFETSLALGAGEYKYLFRVDGEEIPDPVNADRRTENGRTVCVKTVR